MKNRNGYKKDGKYIINCEGHDVEVSKEVYYTIMDEVWREEKRKQRAWRCRDGKGVRCKGDCTLCDINRFGEGPNGNDVSLDQMYEENDYEPKGSDGFEEKSLFWIRVNEEIDEISVHIPEAARIVKMLISGELEKEVAEELGMPPSTLNYKVKGVKKRLSKYLKDFR